MGKLLYGQPVMGILKSTWLDMVEPPWKTDGDWGNWLLVWSWILAGVALGALIAPSLVRRMRLEDTSVQDWLVISVAVLGGLVVQILGIAMAILGFILVDGIADLDFGAVEEIRVLFVVVGVVQAIVGLLLLAIVFLLPFAVVGFGIYLYLTRVGSDQSAVTIAFTGSLLIKTFVIPFIKGIATGALFRWFMKWLRGGKDTKNA